MVRPAPAPASSPRPAPGGCRVAGVGHRGQLRRVPGGGGDEVHTRRVQAEGGADGPLDRLVAHARRGLRAHRPHRRALLRLAGPRTGRPALPGLAQAALPGLAGQRDLRKVKVDLQRDLRAGVREELVRGGADQRGRGAVAAQSRRSRGAVAVPPQYRRSAVVVQLQQSRCSCSTAAGTCGGRGGADQGPRCPVTVTAAVTVTGCFQNS
eukprot:710549-Pyramimonas_sp.AAC.1